MVNKARLRHTVAAVPSVALDVDGGGNSPGRDDADGTSIRTSVVYSKIKVIETRLENDKFVPLPTTMTSGTTDATAAASSCGEKDAAQPKTQEPAAAMDQAPLQSRRKLYDSLFEEKTLSDKERVRRQFLFGAPASDRRQSPPPEKKQPLAPAGPPKAQQPPPPPSKTAPATDSPKDKDETKIPPVKTVPTVNSEKKPKKSCCAIL